MTCSMKCLRKSPPLPVDAQQVLRRLLHHHLDTDFTADINIDNDTLGSIKLFHRYAESEPEAISN